MTGKGWSWWKIRSTLFGRWEMFFLLGRWEECGIVEDDAHDEHAHTPSYASKHPLSPVLVLIKIIWWPKSLNLSNWINWLVQLSVWISPKKLLRPVSLQVIGWRRSLRGRSLEKQKTLRSSRAEAQGRKPNIFRRSKVFTKKLKKYLFDAGALKDLVAVGRAHPLLPLVPVLVHVVENHHRRTRPNLRQHHVSFVPASDFWVFETFKLLSALSQECRLSSSLQNWILFQLTPPLCQSCFLGGSRNRCFIFIQNFIHYHWLLVIIIFPNGNWTYFSDISKIGCSFY